MRPLPPDLTRIPRSRNLPFADALIVPRTAFVNALGRRTDVLKALRELYPLYVEVAEAARSSNGRTFPFALRGEIPRMLVGMLEAERLGVVPSLLSWVSLSRLCRAGTITNADTLRDRIAELAANFKVSERCINSAWMVDVMLHSLFINWARSGSADDLKLYVVRYERDVVTELRIELKPHREDSWDDFAQQARRELEAQLDAIIMPDELRRHEIFTDPAAEIRNEAAFDWLVLYQVVGWSLPKIYDDEAGKGKHSSTIWKGIENAAETLGIPLRQTSGKKPVHRVVRSKSNLQ